MSARMRKYNERKIRNVNLWYKVAVSRQSGLRRASVFHGQDSPSASLALESREGEGTMRPEHRGTHQRKVYKQG